MNFQKSILYRLYQRIFRRNLIGESHQLDQVAQILYRKLYKHVHGAFQRDLQKQQRLEVTLQGNHVDLYQDRRREKPSEESSVFESNG